MNKKKLLSLALVAIMIAILSFSTLAWFNDSDEVTNKFHVATSDDPSDPDDIFSVDVWEKVDTDGDGEPDTPNPGEDADGGEAVFENILPGARYLKNPIVKGDGTLEFDFEDRDLSYNRNCFLTYEALQSYCLASYEVQNSYTPAA